MLISQLKMCDGILMPGGFKMLNFDFFIAGLFSNAVFMQSSNVISDLEFSISLGCEVFSIAQTKLNSPKTKQMKKIIKLFI